MAGPNPLKNPQRTYSADAPVSAVQKKSEPVSDTPKTPTPDASQKTAPVALAIKKEDP